MFDQCFSRRQITSFVTAIQPVIITSLELFTCRRRIQSVSNVRNEHFDEVPFHEENDVATSAVLPKLTSNLCFCTMLTVLLGHAQRDCSGCGLADVQTAQVLPWEAEAGLWVFPLRYRNNVHTAMFPRRRN